MMNDRQSQLFTPTYGGGWSPSPALSAPDAPTSPRLEPHPPAPPFQRKSATSRAGARAIAPKATGLRGMVVGLLHDTGVRGLTIQELSEAMTQRRGCLVKEGCVCGRLNELRRMGKVVDSGRTRIGASGVANTIWILKSTEWTNAN